MVSYSDLTYILHSKNWTSNAGQTTITEISGDPRTKATVSNGVYEVYYTTLTSYSDFTNLGYYTSSDEEYIALSGGSPALNTSQQAIVASILTMSSTDLYRVSFQDVAPITFTQGDTSNADITIGQLDWSNAASLGQTRNDSNNDGVLQHGDVWLNSELDFDGDSSTD